MGHEPTGVCVTIFAPPLRDVGEKAPELGDKWREPGGFQEEVGR